MTRTKLSTKCFLMLFAVITLGATTLLAQNGTPSSKATAAINTTVGCVVANKTTLGTAPMTCHDIFSGADLPVTADNYVTVMSSTMKVSNSQSIFVSPSLVTGLYTQTLVQTRPKSDTSSGTSTAVAEGGVYLRAIVTNLSTGEVQLGYPAAVCTSGILGCQLVGTGASAAYGVTLDTRVQSLTQSISECIVNDLTGAQSGTCDFTLTTDLILKTTSAHTYNFIFPSVGVGVYRIDIQAAVNADATVSGSGTAVGGAAYGLGSLTVESVRLVHDFAF